MKLDPDDVESLARVLCTAAGHDPDEMITASPARSGAKGFLVSPEERSVPSWHVFRHDATVALQWMDAGRPLWKKPGYYVNQGVNAPFTAPDMLA